MDTLVTDSMADKRSGHYHTHRIEKSISIYFICYRKYLEEKNKTIKKMKD